MRPAAAIHRALSSLTLTPIGVCMAFTDQRDPLRRAPTDSNDSPERVGDPLGDRLVQPAANIITLLRKREAILANASRDERGQSEAQVEVPDQPASVMGMTVADQCEPSLVEPTEANVALTTAVDHIAGLLTRPGTDLIALLRKREAMLDQSHVGFEGRSIDAHQEPKPTIENAEV